MSAYTPSAPGCGIPPGRNPLFALVVATTFALLLVSGGSASDYGREGQHSYAADAVADTLRDVLSAHGTRDRGAS